MLCLMAMVADGEKHEREREQIRRIAESFRGSEVDLSALYQEVLLRKPAPSLELRDGEGSLITSSDSWVNSPQQSTMHKEDSASARRDTLFNAGAIRAAAGLSDV